MAPIAGRLKTSVIIPVLNEAGFVRDAIDRAWSAGAQEVIVVDGGSSDSTASVAAQCNCQFLEGPQGRGPQMNCGAQHATGDVILFLHADSWLPENALLQIDNALKNSDAVGGGFRQKLGSGKWIYRFIEKGNAWRARYQRLIYGDQGLFVRRSVFEQLGGFAQIRLMEDFEFSQRCFAAAAPVLLEGPIHIDVRRWEAHGPIATTIKNWRIAWAWRCGADSDELYNRYYDS